VKQLKLYLIIFLFILSGRLFSQSIKPADLIGKWEWKNISFDFKNDSSVLLDRGGDVKMCSFTIDTLANDQTISMISQNENTQRMLVWKIRRLGQDEINLEMYKIKEFNNATKHWDERDLIQPPSLIFERRPD
jgi:hypothetical protein